MIRIMADHLAGSGRKCDIWPEIASLDPQNTSTYLRWPFMMIRTNFKKSSKIIISCPNWHVKPIMYIWTGNDDFWWFLKICSNYHKWSSKVCRSTLGVQRSHFRPQIVFLDTSGQMIGHNANHQKSVQIAKITILAKNSNFFKVAGTVQKMDIWDQKLTCPTRIMTEKVVFCKIFAI